MKTETALYVLYINSYVSFGQDTILPCDV